MLFVACLFCSIFVASADSAFLPSKPSTNHTRLPMLCIYISSWPPQQGRFCSEIVFLRYASPPHSTISTVPCLPNSFRQPLSSRCNPVAAPSPPHPCTASLTRWRQHPPIATAFSWSPHLHSSLHFLQCRRHTFAGAPTLDTVLSWHSRHRAFTHSSIPARLLIFTTTPPLTAATSQQDRPLH